MGFSTSSRRVWTATDDGVMSSSTSCKVTPRRCHGLILVFILAWSSCTSTHRDYTLYSGAGNDEAEGPWSRFPGILLSKSDLTQYELHGLLRFDALQLMADQLLELEGATICDSSDPTKRKPVPNASAEYCSAMYVVNTTESDDNPSYELRLTKPRRRLTNAERSCIPPKSAKDLDFPARHVTIIGLIHNHTCWSGPSTPDMGTWPVDFDFTQNMARVDLYPGNAVTGEPPIAGGTPLLVQSYIFAQKDKQRIYLLLRTTGDVHQWSGLEWNWRARCEPAAFDKGPAKCTPPFKLIGE